MANKPRRKRFIVTITEEMINTAVPRDSGHCMIADAVRASIPDAINVMVDLQCIRWTNRAEGLRYAALTPLTGQRALLDFDNSVKPEPFSLRVEPFQIVPSGGTAKRPKPSDGSRRQRVLRKVTPGPLKMSGSDGSPGRVGIGAPLIEGGRLPPTGALSNSRGKRRAFGLRIYEK